MQIDEYADAFEASTEVKPCPIRIAIKEIHGSGLYTDESSSERSLIVGGVEYICDEASFKLSSRMIEVARVLNDIRNGSTNNSANNDTTNDTITNLFAHINGKTPLEVFNEAISQLRTKVALCSLMGRLHDNLEVLGGVIQRRLRVSNTFFVSLPDVITCSSSNDELYHTAIQLANYAKTILPEISVEITRPPTILLPSTIDIDISSINSINSIFEKEKLILREVIKYEEYQCKIIGEINSLSNSIQSEIAKCSKLSSQ